MTDSEKKTKTPVAHSEAKAERVLRRMLEGMGSVLDRKLGRDTLSQGGMSTATLLARMKRGIDERVRDTSQLQRVAPHALRLKIEWGTHSEVPAEQIKELEHEVLAAAIDHINDQRLRTLAPVRVEVVKDIFTTGINVEPTFGEFEEQLKQEDEAARRRAEGLKPPTPEEQRDVPVSARISIPGLMPREVTLAFKPGGRRFNVGRASDNELNLNHASVSKVHAALLMNRETTILVADTGSTNGTFINGRRIAYGEARAVEDGDVLGFGDVEMRLRKQAQK